MNKTFFLRIEFIFALGIISIGIFGFVLFGFASSSLTKNVAGKILLDVENNGEAWYVHPTMQERYFLGNPDDAYEIMRLMGLGISTENLNKIPLSAESFVGDINLRQRLSGRILLQVESRGEAWYIDPVNLQKHFLGSAADAFAVMREFGLGITSDQLQQIPNGGIVQPIKTIDTPFVAQAPFAEWEDLRQQEGCEEASVLMAMHWVQGKTSIDGQMAKDAIIDMSEQQRTVYGTYIDTSAQDTVDRLFKRYYNYHNVEVEYAITLADIRSELMKGNLVIVPINGKSIQNPYFRAGGPQRHMIVIIGFDWQTGEFITHEPGTKRGENYRYSSERLGASLRDYPSGNYIPIPENSPSAMIIVEK